MALNRQNYNLAATAVTAAHTEASPAGTAWLPVGLGLSGTIRITNGSTAPTTECKAAVRVRSKGSTTWEYWAGPFYGGKDGSGSYAWQFTVGVEWEEAQVVFFGLAGSSVTASAEISSVTSLV